MDPTKRLGSQTWGEAVLDPMAKRLGLAWSQEGRTVVLAGPRADFEVRATFRPAGHDGEIQRFVLRVEVTAAGPLVADPITVFSRIEAGLGRSRPPPPVRSGDDVFDRDMHTFGVRTTALSSLTHRARALMLGHGGRWDVSGGRLTWEGRRAPTFLEGVIRDALELCALLEHAAKDPMASLGERALFDGHTGARLVALDALLAENRPRGSDVARKLLSDRLPRMRLEAAKRLGAEGHPVLLSLVSASVSAELWREAAAALPATDEQLEDRLARLARHPSDDLAVAALRLLSRHGGPRALAAIESLDLRQRGHSVRRATAAARSAILARHAGLEAGQLAIAPSEGDLALSSD